MQYGIYILGILATALTSFRICRNSRKRCRETPRRTENAGRALGRAMPWVVYGVAKDDWVIILANSIGAALALALLGFKIRDLDS
jgi:hypothetical protein